MEDGSAAVKFGGLQSGTGEGWESAGGGGQRDGDVGFLERGRIGRNVLLDPDKFGTKLVSLVVCASLVENGRRTNE